jgi:arsenite-transporting ATPase
VRVLLHVGKGGAGTTTVAAATAVAASRAGIKTLLLATGAPSSLTDVLGLAPDALSGAPDQGGELELEPGLSVLRTSSDPLTGAATRLRRLLADVLGGLGVEAGVSADVLSLAGADEGGDIAALASLRRQVQDGPWDLVVVDVTGGGEALRVLTAPDALLRVVGRLRAPGSWPGQRGLGPDPELLRSAAQLHTELAAVRDVLRARTTSVRLVLTAQAVSLAQARRTFTTLAVHGYLVDGIVANAVPTDDAGPGPSSAEARVLEEADELFAPLPVRRLPRRAVEPIGAQALLRLGGALLQPTSSSPDPVEGLLETPVAAPGPRVRRVADGYELVLSAPLAAARQIELSRHGDELALSVHGSRCAVPLPSVLRRCLATGAQVSHGSLVVSFVPDPALWPTRSATGAGDTEAAR